MSWILAVVLGLAPEPLYGAYAALAHRPGGLSALADQQLAAGVMWVPGSVPYCIVLVVAAFRWLDPAAGPRPRRVAVTATFGRGRPDVFATFLTGSLLTLFSLSRC